MNWRRSALGFVLAAVLWVGLLPLGTLAAGAREATVLFTHDLHACFLPRVQADGTERGGAARLATVLQEARREHPNALTVDGGDFCTGSLVQALSTDWGPELQLLGALGYDAVTAGDHEFDNGGLRFGAMLTAARRNSSALPALVMANFRPAPENPDQLDIQRAVSAYGTREYWLLERGGVRYGVFGLLGQSAGADAEALGFVLEDPAQAAQRCVERLEEQGADLIICLLHSGTEAPEDAGLAEAVDGIDLIVSNCAQTAPAEPRLVGDTYLVSAGPAGAYVGCITFSWTEAGEPALEDYQQIAVDETVPEDPALAASVADWMRQVDANYLGAYGFTYDQILTRSDFVLARPEEPGLAGNALGELTADAFRWAAERLAGAEPDAPTVAFTAAGALHASLPRGDLTTAQVFDVLCTGAGADGSTGSPLVSFYLTGSELRALLEADAAISPRAPEFQLYASGVEYLVNPNRMFWNKVLEARLSKTGEPLERDGTYRVVASLYSVQHLDEAADRSFGLLSIVPKDEAGEPVSDWSARILYDSSGQELKEWTALAAYLQSFGPDGIPTSYAWPDGRKEVSHSWNPIELIRSPSLLTVGILLLAALLAAGAVCLLRNLFRRRRSGRYGGYRRKWF